MKTGITEVYVAIISEIHGLERSSFSQVLNDYKDRNPYATTEDFSVKDMNDIPTDHLVNDWLEALPETRYWASWMKDATDLTFYQLVTGTMEQPLQI